MAKAGASKKDDKGFYILYCCTNCDDKFGSEDALEKHIKTCKPDPDSDTSWIKQEPLDENTESGPSQPGLSQPTSSLPFITPNISAPLSVIKTEPVDQKPVPVALSGPSSVQQCVPQSTSANQAVPPSPVIMLANQMAAPQLIGQSQVTAQPSPTQLIRLPSPQFVGQPHVLLPQFMAPAPIMSTQLVVQPQVSTQQVLPQVNAQLTGPKPQYYNAAQNLTASEILRQRFQKQQGDAPSSTSLQPSSTTLGSTSIAPTPPCDQPILPKETNVSSATKQIKVKSTKVCSIKVKSQSSDDPTLPKIKRVYYTSDANGSTIVEASVTNVFTGAKSLLRRRKSSQLEKVLPKNKGESEKSDRAKEKAPTTPENFLGKCGVKQLPSGKQCSEATGAALPTKLQAGTGKGVAVVHPQQNIVQATPAPTLVQQPTQVLIQTPQGIFQISKPFLQKQQSSFQSSQTYIQSLPSLLQTNQTPFMFQPNLMQVQAGQLNPQTSQLVTTPVVSPLHITVQASSTGASVLSTHPSSGSMKILQPTLTTTSVSPKNQAGESASTGLANEPASALLKSPGSVSATGTVKSPVSSSCLVSPTGAPGDDLSPASTTAVPNHPVSLAPGLTQQNSSNVVFLPPVLSQGHVLGGIHLAPPTVKPANAESQSSGRSESNMQQQLVISNLGSCPDTVREGKMERKHASTGMKLNEQKAGDTSQTKNDKSPSQDKFSFPNTNISTTGEKLLLPNPSLVYDCFSPSDSIARDTAKMLLFGSENKEQALPKQGPVVLEDGRIFLPIAYPGPYTLRSNKPSRKQVKPCKPSWPWLNRKKALPKEMVEKSDRVKTREQVSDDIKILEGPEATREEEEESEQTPPQTITLPGDVWVFLDKDGPKLLWKVDEKKQQMIVLPLDFQLPTVAVRQIVDMLQKANIEFPPDLLSSSPLPQPQKTFAPRHKKEAQNDPKLVEKMEQIMSGKISRILPKKELSITTTEIKPQPVPAAPSQTLPTASLTLPTPALSCPIRSVSNPAPFQLQPTSLSLPVPSFPSPLLLPTPSLPLPTPPLPSYISPMPTPLLRPQPSIEAVGEQVQTNLSAAPAGINPGMPPLLAGYQCYPVTSLQSTVVFRPPPIVLEQKQDDPQVRGASSSQSLLSTVASEAPERQDESDNTSTITHFRSNKANTLQRLKRASREMPQLTVGADAATVKRALEAVVVLEQIPLTEELQKQIQLRVRTRKSGTHKTGVKVTMTDFLNWGKRGRKPMLLQEFLRRDVRPEHTTRREDGNLQSASKLTGQTDEPSQELGQDKKYEEKEQSFAVKTEPDETSHENIYKNEREDCGKISNKARKIVGFEHSKPKRRKTTSQHLQPEDDKDTEFTVRRTSKDHLQAGVRRSVRIFCKPKPDYSVLNSHQDTEEDQFPQSDPVASSADTQDKKRRTSSDIESRAICQRGRPNSMKRPSIKRSLGKHSGFDVYIESVDDSMEDIEMEEEISEDGITVKNDPKESETSAYPEDDACSCEQFLRKHKSDFDKVVLKEAKETTGKGAQGHILYLCMICGSFQSRSSEELRSHLSTHYGKLNCKECYFKAASEQELLEHDALEHTGKPLYHCSTCQTSFFSQAIFQNHLRRHDSSVTCKVCQVKLSTKEGLKEHMEKEHAEDYLCHLCDKHFGTEAKLRVHYTMCIDGYQCCLCSVKMALYSDLRQHMVSKHSHEGPLQVCTVSSCGKTFLTAEELAQHRTVHPNLQPAQLPAGPLTEWRPV